MEEEEGDQGGRKRCGADRKGHGAYRGIGASGDPNIGADGDGDQIELGNVGGMGLVSSLLADRLAWA